MAYSPIEATAQVGTFAVKQLVYAFAMWISAEFHLKVIDTLDAVVAGQISNPATTTKIQSAAFSRFRGKLAVPLCRILKS